VTTATTETINSVHSILQLCSALLSACDNISQPEIYVKNMVFKNSDPTTEKPHFVSITKTG
jgi:hypothetical protein